MNDIFPYEYEGFKLRKLPNNLSLEYNQVIIIYYRHMLEVNKAEVYQKSLDHIALKSYF